MSKVALWLTTTLILVLAVVAVVAALINVETGGGQCEVDKDSFSPMPNCTSY